MEFSIYSIVFILAVLSGMTTLIGVWLAFITKRKKSWIVFGIGFSTGIMLLISVFELIPSAVRGAGLIPALIAEVVGLLLAVGTNHIIPHSHLVREEPKSHRPLIAAAYLVSIGLILHDVPEGFAMANSFVLSPSVGILVAIAITLHNIPEEYAIAIPLIAAGKSKRTIYKFAFFSGLAEPAGAILGLIAVTFFIGLNPLLVGFAAGIMVYVAIHELWPMARRYGMPRALATGILSSIAVYIVLAALITQ